VVVLTPPFDRYVNVGIAEDAIVGDGRVPARLPCLVWPLSDDDDEVEEMEDECPCC